MDGIEYSDRDFFQEQRENDRYWKWPLNLAIGLHVVVFAGAIILPDLIEHKPLLDNVVTVDLVSMPEPVAPPAAAKPTVRPVVPVKQAPVVKPAVSRPEPKAPEVSVAPEEATPEPAAPVKQISLKPLKRKIRKVKDTRLAEEKEREQRARAQKQQALARKKAEQVKKRREQARRKQAIADARRAQQEADRAAARARQELASVIRERGPAGAAAGSSRSSSGRKVQSAVLKQYLSSLYERVHSYWVLPNMRKWDNGLETIVVLTIRNDGSISNMQIEQNSKDSFFDQFVMKTLQSAAPMPRFPALMSQPSIEVGLRFKPGELAM